MASGVPALSDDELGLDSYAESSPDPLALSWNDSRLTKTRTTFKKPPGKTALRAGSPNKQRQQTLETNFSSPSKSMILNTGKAGGGSPWKIKVTVEAEPGSDEENVGYGSPSRGRTTRAKTTTVPLKDPDESSPTRRRGPGRARKLADSSPTKAQRGATPVRKKSRSRKSTIGVANMGMADSSAENIVKEPKKRRGRPRKSIQLGTDILSNETTADPTPEETQDEGYIGASRRQLLKTKKVPVRFSSSELGTPEPTQEHRPTTRLIRRGTPIRSGSQPEDSSILSQPTMTGPSPEARKPVKFRKGTPVRPDVSDNSCKPTTASETDAYTEARITPEGASPYQSTGTSATGSRHRLEATSSKGEPMHRLTFPSEVVSESKSTLTSQRRMLDKRTSASENELSYRPTSTSSESDLENTPPASDDGENASMRTDVVSHGSQRGSKELPIELEVGDESDDLDNVEIEDEEDYGFEDDDRTLAGFDGNTTIMESENFTMVSIDSLPSYQAMSSPPMEQVGKLDATRVHGRIRDRIQRSDHQIHEQPSLVSIPDISSTGLTPSNVKISSPAVKIREKTPAMDAKSPSAPPPIELSHSSPAQKPPTPKLGRVVKAGIALQGLVDPIQEPSSEDFGQTSAEKKKERLDNLFNGFGEGTRRELRAGLRLGEQIARMSQERENLSSSVRPSGSKVPEVKLTEEDVFRSSTSKSRPAQTFQPRLPTPDERDHYSLAIPPSTTTSPDVHYPDLTSRAEQTHLASPARSDDEMSWRVDTPPLKPIEPVGNRLHHYMGSKTDMNLEAPEVIVIEDDGVDEDEQSDIWEEEASRSSDLSTSPKAISTTNVEDELVGDGYAFPPARGKIPKTWRRKSSSDFHYSDEIEAEVEQLPTSVATQPESKPPMRSDKGKEKAEEPLPVEEYDEQEESESSDDTGMFWQQNLPSVYNKKSASDEHESQLDLTMLLGGDSSPAKQISVKTPHRGPRAKKVSPRIAIAQTQAQAPYKGSPLKQQFTPGDLRSSLSSSRNARTSATLNSSTSSDVRQLRAETEARSYEPHSLTLHEIEEVTEQSHVKASTSTYPSSPPEVVDNTVFEKSILAPKRAYSPLFQDSKTKPSTKKAVKFAAPQQSTSAIASSIATSKESLKGQSGLFSRLTSTLWSAVTPAAPPPLHPSILKFSPLPRAEPWTKTHYKTLDALFQIHKRKPASFAPAVPPNTNNALLETVANRKKFIGAVYSNWGYDVTITEQHLVLAAAFMQLLTLTDIEEYERKTDKSIDRGEVGPGPDGEILGLEAVLKRLFTVIAGEDLRRDEELGKRIRREGGLTITWAS